MLLCILPPLPQQSVQSYPLLAIYQNIFTCSLEEQARIQANALRDFSKIQDEKNRQELAAKSDIHDMRLEMQRMKYDLLKWQFGIALALAAIMAKGFGWLGF